MVSIALVVIVMTSATMLFITNMSVTSYLRGKQAATQLADDAMEQSRGFSAKALYMGRDQTSSETQWSTGSSNAVVKPLLDVSTDVWSSSAAANSGQSCSLTPAAGVTPCIPTVPVTQLIGNHTYQVSTYIGGCVRSASPDGGAACVSGDPLAADGTTQIGFLRVIVAVTWTDNTCPAGECTYVTAELRNATTGDPVFNLNTGTNVNVSNNSVLTLQSPGDQSTTAGVPVSLGLLYSGGTGTVTFSATTLPTGLSIDSNSGLIYGTPVCGQPSGCAVAVRATDGLGEHSDIAFTWTVNPKPTIALTASDAVRTQPYTLTPTVTGGTAPITYALTGTLPAGLSFNTSNGVISGTPTAEGTANLTLTVTDRSGQTDAVGFTLKVVPPPPPTITTAATTGSGKVGTAITTFGNTVKNGDPTLTWSASNLPAGLNIDSSSGAITGTPTTPGTSTATIKVTDSQGRSDTRSVTWTINTIVQNLPADGTTTYCMDVYGASMVDGQRVVFYTCNGGTNQSWYVAADHTLQVKDSAGTTVKCLKYAGTTSPQIVIATCDPSAVDQQWTASPSSGALQISNGADANVGLCLGVPNNATAGTNLDMGSCTNGNRRIVWKFGP